MTMHQTQEELESFLLKLSFVQDQKAEAERIVKVQETYPMQLTTFIKDRIIETQSYGLYKQFIPCYEELYDDDGVGAFFADEKHLTDSIVQKYPNRCIIYLTNQCFSNCRHCSRKSLWVKRSGFSRIGFDEDYRYLLSTNMEEIILTGGDPLTIGYDNLAYVLDRITSLEGIRVVRLATRAFTVAPSTITSQLCDLLSIYPNLVIMTQFNHPDEFSPETIAALFMVQKTGCPIFNQSVLLKGINDSLHVMRELLTKCVENRVIPYYLFHAFKVKGAQCFRTNLNVGTELIDQLIGEIGGWWIPRYTIIPEQTGVKIPIRPNGIIKNDSEGAVVKDFQGRVIKYE